MKKNTLSFLILISGILISGGIISSANAQTDNQTTPTISYPIVELGNCVDKASCKTYCDKQENIDACLSFAEKNNLMKKEEINAAKKFKDTGMVGPGACKGKDACEQYCSSSTHLEECTAFAEKNGMMSDQQLKDSKKVIAAIKSGLKPPACSGPKQCNTYCSNPTHMEECMTFSIAAGIVQDNQKEQMQKTLEALKQGVKPPACEPNPPSDQLGQSGQANQSVNGLPSCDQYCGTHQEECMTFSLATGMVPDSQKEQVKKTIEVFKQGIKPPACRPNPPDQSGQPSQPGQSGPNQGQGFNPGSGVNGNGPGLKNNINQSKQSDQGLQSCDLYCADSSHVEECVKFSVAIGNMTEEQGQNSIKNGNKGPGGCVGKDACDTFCGNPENQDACFNFAKDNGMISQENLKKIQQGPGQGGSRQPGDQGQGNFNVQSNNEQIQPWADMCQPDGNGKPTSLACADDVGNFVVSAKAGSDGKPVCPTGSTAKCGNYEQENQQRGLQGNQNQQGQQGGSQGNLNKPMQPDQPNQLEQGGPRPGGPNQGQGFNPGSGVNGNGNGPGGGQSQIQPGQPGQKGPGPGILGQPGGTNQGQGGPGNNGGGGGQSGWSNGTGNGGGNGGPDGQGGPGMGGPGRGGPNEGQGFNPGSGVNGNGNGPGGGQGSIPSGGGPGSGGPAGGGGR